MDGRMVTRRMDGWMDRWVWDERMDKKSYHLAETLSASTLDFMFASTSA